MYEGDILCNSCFSNRKQSASSTSYQDLMEKNWGLYFIPIGGTILGLSRLKRTLIDDAGGVWHVYINGNHEIWHDYRKNEYNKQRCKKCSNYESYYYELDKIK